MTQTERIHNLQRLWGTIEARIASDSDLRENVEFRMLNELIKGLHGRPELTVVVTAFLAFLGAAVVGVVLVFALVAWTCSTRF